MCLISISCIQNQITEKSMYCIYVCVHRYTFKNHKYTQIFSSQRYISRKNYKTTPLLTRHPNTKIFNLARACHSFQIQLEFNRHLATLEGGIRFANRWEKGALMVMELVIDGGRNQFSAMVKGGIRSAIDLMDESNFGSYSN